MERKYIVRGNPVPLARCRYGNRRVFDSQKNLKLYWAIELKKQHRDEYKLSGPLFLETIFYMPLNQKSWSQKKKDELANTWHFKKPDISNLLKFIEDVIVQAQIIVDDSQFSHSLVKKLYDDGSGARTEIIIREMNEN